MSLDCSPLPLEILVKTTFHLALEILQNCMTPLGWEGGGREGEAEWASAPPLKSFLTMCPFFEETFKFAFFENIKSEIVNI